MRACRVPAAAIALALLLAGQSSAAARERPQRTLPAPSGPVKADRDRDGVFDDLERRVRELRAEQRLPVIVTLGRPATAERVDALRRDAGGFSVRHRYRIINAFSATVRAGQVRALAARREVVHVEEDSAVYALNDGAQASFGVTKARLDAPHLDGDGDGVPGLYSKDDLVAAVIDTGIDAVHQDLDEGKVIAFRDYVNGRTSPYDDEGHGTHVAATIAGEGDARVDGLHKGVAPAGALVGLKVLDSAGEGAMSDVAAAIDWAVANRSVHGIEVVNLSLGAAGCADGTDAASRSVDAAHDAGLVVAVAAGNEGPGTCTIGSPGAARKALTVGAMADRSAGGFYQGYFSSRGKTADGRVKPDVSAPGVDITSAAAGTATGYVAYSGTSMATPFVAGLALLMRDAAAIDSDAVTRRIADTAIDWGRGGDNRTAGTTGPDIDYGIGRLDGYAALAAAGAPLVAPPPAPAHHVREGSFTAGGQQADFPVEVSDMSFPIAATMIMSDLSAGSANNPNFDLYLLAPDGTQVAASTYATRQEEVFHQPTAPGTYTVRVTSRRGSGRFFVDLSGGAPADVIPPDTTIVAGPSGTTTSPTAEFSFSSSEGLSTFECRLDGGAWAACTSPKSYGSLAEGIHTFDVRARDAAGNRDPTPATRTWTVEATPPDTTITSAPSTPTNETSATFTFTSSESNSTFECRLDSGPWESCPSTKTYTGLADGGHTFAVRAIDAAGNADATPATYSWTVDATPPETSISSGPSAPTNETSATFGFTASEAGATFECRLDGGAWGTCASPKTYTGLTDGSHSFAVRAKDGLGNVDATPATRSWTVDTTAPDTSITSGPSTLTNDGSATFAFGSSESGAEFECRLDGGAWAVCPSPTSYGDLADGSHTFDVRATDAAGNTDATPATRSWTVDTTAPSTTITSGPATSTEETSATFSFTSSEAGSTFRCRLDGAAWTTCTSPKTYSDLEAGGHTFEVSAADAAGNLDPTPATHSWTIDTTGPDTSITAAPRDPINQSSANFAFTSGDSDVTFECRLDGGAWGTCASPKTYTGLGDGGHSFAVRAKDALGNVDATPAGHSWTIDTVPPDTTITAAPAAATGSTSASFSFTSSEAGSVFACNLDADPWTTGCTSPQEYAGLSTGTHTFRVRATDAAGNTDATPAWHEWTIESDFSTAETSDGTAADESTPASGTTTPTPAPTPDPGQSAATGDQAPPAGALLVMETADLRTTLRRGLPVTFTCGRGCRAVAKAYLTRRTARRLGLRSRRARLLIGREAMSVAADGPATLNVGLRKAARRAIARSRGVRLLLRVHVTGPAGTRSLSRHVALSRRTLAVARRRGVRGTITCTSGCTGTAHLVVTRRTARRLGLPSRRLGRGSATLDGAEETEFVVRLTRRASSRLRDTRRVHAALKTRLSRPPGIATRLSARLLLRQ